MALEKLKWFLRDAADKAVTKVKSEEFRDSVKNSIRKTLDNAHDSYMRQTSSSAGYREYRKEKRLAQEEREREERMLNDGYNDD